MNPNIYKLSEMTKEQYDFVMKRAETDISEHMKVAKEVSVELTDSIFRAIYLLHKLEKEWYCVTIKFRRNKVKNLK